MPEFIYNKDWEEYAGVAESVDALDSKSSGVYPPCGFDSHLRHFPGANRMNSILLIILPEFISHIKKLIWMVIVWMNITFIR